MTVSGSLVVAALNISNGITVNKNGVPNDPRSFKETSGIRLGTAAEVTRGHDSKWFTELGNRIVEILNT